MDKLTKIQKLGFYLALIVALAISWWSITTMAVDFFHLPLWLAIGASVAFDGAALFVAALASNYARSEDSGAASRFATVMFVAASAYLNIMHAKMLGFGLPGMFFLGAPAIIAGILFELYLKYEHRKALRERGRVVEAMPVLGKLSWVIYPGQAFKVIKQILKDRLLTVASTIDNKQVPVMTQAKAERLPVRKVQEQPAIEPVKRGRPRKTIEQPAVPSNVLFAGLEPTSSHSKLTYHLMDRGIDDKEVIIKAVSDYSGREMSPNSFSQYKKRFKQSQSTPGYL